MQLHCHVNLIVWRALTEWGFPGFVPHRGQKLNVLCVQQHIDSSIRVFRGLVALFLAQYRLIRDCENVYGASNFGQVPIQSEFRDGLDVSQVFRIGIVRAVRAW